MSVLGLHHITIVCHDAQRTVDFYSGVLGLRLIKRTVNFDAPDSYHLYFGNEAAEPGSAITFFEWPWAPKGRWGIGGTHHFAMITTDRHTLRRWKRRLTDRGIPVTGPLDRHYFESIYFTDPDGTILEIATLGPGWSVDEAPDDIGTAFREPPAEMVVRNRDENRIAADTCPDPVPAISQEMALSRGLHHITAIGSDIKQTHGFFGDLLGMRRVKMTSNFDDPTSAHWYWGTGDGRPGTLITYFERPRERRMAMGAGQTHHFALAVQDEDSQLQWRERLVKAGLQVTPVLDRVYFKSIYTRDPDGHIVELATLGPGFAVDEDRTVLGSSLKLPPWLEHQRSDISRSLRPLEVEPWRSPDPVPAR